MDCSLIQVKRFNSEDVELGSKRKFLNNLEKTREELKGYVFPMYEYIRKEWKADTPFIFEKAQAIGLDSRWGVYPDVTASNCCLDGITYSTEGVIDANDISARFGVIKSTYTSSVGKRKIPTFMEEKYAQQLRDDANEYGTTTGRPRDIAYLDLEMLKYFCKVGGIEELVFTHMDIIYKRDVKVCIGYKREKEKSYYRPDQKHLENVKPIYKKLKYWEKEELKKCKTYLEVQKEAQDFVQFISKETDTTPVMITYGPDRSDTILI